MKKFSKKLIFYSIFTGILIALIAFGYCLMAFQTNDEEFILDSKLLIIAFVIATVIFLLFFIYFILFYNLSGYELNETQIICKRGVLFKKKSILDYSKINSINKKQGIIQKLFGISCLMVDSGSTTRAHQAEIMIIEDTKVVNELYSLLKSIDKNNPAIKKDIVVDNDVDNKDDNLYVFNSKAKIIYTFVNSIIFFIVFLIIAALIFGVSLMAYYFPDETEDAITLFDVSIISISTYVIMVLSILLGNLVKAFIGYYNFRITKNNDTINIEYGLIVNNHNTFKLSKVKGVLVTQGIFQRIFKLASIKIEVIGYVEATNNNNNGVIGILIPLCKLSEVTTYLEKIIPSHVPVKQENKAKSFISFISWNTFFALGITILCLISAISISLGFGSFLVLAISCSIIGGIFIIYELLLIVNSLFAYYAQDITFDKDSITVHNGAFIKCSTVIKKSDITSIEDITTKFRAKKGIFTYVIHFHTNAFSNTKKVKMIDKKYKDMLLNCLEY